MIRKITFIGLLACLLAGWDCNLYAQRTSSIDTLHIFKAKADTIWLKFDEDLPLAATGDKTFHYLYRWFSNGKKIGEENVLNYSFTGERKAKVTGQRFSTALPWPGEEYLDMEYFKGGRTLECDYMDTVYLKAFSEYESDSTATWIWSVERDSKKNDTLFGSRIKVTYDKNTFYNECTVTCTLQTETEKKYAPLGTIDFLSPGIYGKEDMRLIDSGRGCAYTMDMFSIDASRIYAHTDDRKNAVGK